MCLGKIIGIDKACYYHWFFLIYSEFQCMTYFSNDKLLGDINLVCSGKMCVPHLENVVAQNLQKLRDSI